MDELILKEYLKSNGYISESDFIKNMKSLFNKRNTYLEHDDIIKDNMSDREYYSKSGREYYTKRDSSTLEELIYSLNSKEKEKVLEMLNKDDKHFNESKAKTLVSEMYHMSEGRKYIGEYFSIEKAKEICEKYRAVIPTNITHCDIYVAINSQYHDYCILFKNWFGDNIDSRIIESAIIYWFKDDDYEGLNKVFEYFKD